MKKVIQVTEVEGEGLAAFLGKSITILCDTYIYTGTLVGINDECVMLEEPKLVYETGEWGAKNWKDAQTLPSPAYVQKGKIESFFGGK